MSSGYILEENINITKEKLVAFYHKNQKYIFTTIACAILFIMAFIVFSQYQKKKYTSLSTNFYQKYFSEQLFENSQYFQKIYQEHKSKKISALPALNYADSLIQKNQINQAVKLYQEISQNKSYDVFIRNFADFLQLKAMITHDYQKFDVQITKLLKYLTKKQNHHLKYHIFEQEAVFLLLKGDKQQSYQKFMTLANPLNNDISVQIKNRAKVMIKNHENN